ncbi:MAG: Fic family protein [Desulfofustis sp.]|nr:Fic family protein [Desulfofustis sp.]
MKKSGRYRTSELVEDSFEPGSRGRVLQNKLGITGKRAMDEVEAREQFRALSYFLEEYDRDHRFTAQDICRMHEIWLGPVYEWAGNYRQVNIMKGGFPFAMARQVPVLMEQLEVGPLHNHTPCRAEGHEEIIHAVAVVHAELVLIHPFREGNGRLARMLAVLMGLQAGLPPFDFGGLKGRQRQRYFAAVQAGLAENYTPMEQVFRSVLRRTVQRG